MTSQKNSLEKVVYPNSSRFIEFLSKFCVEIFQITFESHLITITSTNSEYFFIFDSNIIVALF